jgi:hypothetical protein
MLLIGCRLIGVTLPTVAASCPATNSLLTVAGPSDFGYESSASSGGSARRSSLSRRSSIGRTWVGWSAASGTSRSTPCGNLQTRSWELPALSSDGVPRERPVGTYPRPPRNGTTTSRSPRP